MIETRRTTKGLRAAIIGALLVALGVLVAVWGRDLPIPVEVMVVGSVMARHLRGRNGERKARRCVRSDWQR